MAPVAMAALRAKKSRLNTLFFVSAFSDSAFGQSPYVLWKYKRAIRKSLKRQIRLVPAIRFLMAPYVIQPGNNC